MSDPKLFDLPRAGFSPDEFCKRNSICRGTLYNRWNDDSPDADPVFGTGPRYMKLGSRRIITAEAEADWHRDREAATAAKLSGKSGSAGEPQTRLVRRSQPAQPAAE
jgi:hypothetical protein